MSLGSKNKIGRYPEMGKLTTILQDEFPKKVISFHSHRGDETVVIEKDAFESICKFLMHNNKHNNFNGVRSELY